MRVLPFMLAVFAGRLVRWLVLSLLVLKLGPSAVSLMTDLSQRPSGDLPGRAGADLWGSACGSYSSCARRRIGSNRLHDESREADPSLRTALRSG
jgi:hypothetical protein